MNQLRNILVAVDFSDCSKPRWPRSSASPAGTARGFTPFQKRHTDALQERLGEFVDQHKGSNLRSVVFPWSSYGQGIAQYAQEVKADLIILGTRGHTSLRYVLLGSTAEQLLRELPCSVLTVRPGDAETILPIP